MAMLVEMSSLEELEEVLGALSSDAQRAVRVRVARLEDLFEAYPLLSRLNQLVDDSGSRWELEDGSHALLLQASEYYQSLDLLELHLDLMRMDIEEGIAMRKIRFDGVRQTANEVVGNADPTSTFMVLDDITIEGQRIARVANLLGFGGAEVEESKLTEDDIQWFLADFGEVEGVELVAPGEGALSDQVDALHLGDSKDLDTMCGDGKDPDTKCGGRKELDTKGEDGKDKDSRGDGKDIDTKEDVTKGVLLRKISKLQEVLHKSKRGPFTV